MVGLPGTTRPNGGVCESNPGTVPLGYCRSDIRERDRGTRGSLGAHATCSSPDSKGLALALEHVTGPGGLVVWRQLLLSSHGPTPELGLRLPLTSKSLAIPVPFHKGGNSPSRLIFTLQPGREGAAVPLSVSQSHWLAQSLGAY